MFSETKKNVIRARENFAAPEAYKLLQRADTREMTGKVITLDSIIVTSKVKYDTETREPILKKNGEPVFQQIVFVAFDNGKYFSTKSMLLLEELEMEFGIKLKFNEVKEVTIDKVKGAKVKVATEKVRYADKKLYDQIIFEESE